jgi:uncharacterized membrane protein
MSATSTSTPDNSDLNLRVDLIISNILRWGVAASLVLIVIGTVMSFGYSHDYGAGWGSAQDLKQMIQPDATFPFAFGALLSGLAQFQGQSILVLGLLLLIATPVARVAVSIFTFALEKDWIYVVITSIVFILLMVSFCLGKVG